MPRYLPSDLAETVLSSLGDALDLLDFGLVLLDRDLRPTFINRRMGDIWNIEPEFLEAGPTFRELLEYAARNGRYDKTEANLPAYLDDRTAAVCAGSTSPAVIELADGRRILFRCAATPNCGRILTYADISHELQREAADAVARVSAELRFNSEMLEEQAAHLATLAESAEESAQRAERARLMLEREIAERQQLEIKLRHLATTDGLTGALNRSEFLTSAQREMDARQGTGRKLVVLMIDVDHFKAINDRFGHAGGDRALEQLAGTLRSGIRQIDLLGRLGGEEFSVVLPDTPLTAAEMVAERICQRVAETPVVFGEQRIPMTVSIGMAIQFETDRSVEQIIARADDALYCAKRSGRNRVERAQRPEAA